VKLPGLLLLVISLSAAAQTHPMPGKVGEPLVICTPCKGYNSASELNEGKPTFPYDSPLIGHVGRYLSSEQVKNIQNVGMRTIRADEEFRIRGNRVYVDMGSTIAVYPLDEFFGSRLQEPAIPVTKLATGWLYGQRTIYERLARPDAFIYPEAKTSGWGALELYDSFERLADFDTDDRGHVYYGSTIWGWGIHRDDGRTNLSHLPFVARVPDSNWSNPLRFLFTMKVGQSYYAFVSTQRAARLYDVTDAAQPLLVSTRDDAQRVDRGWSKHDASGRVAIVNAEQQIVVYSYAGLVEDDAPLFIHAAPTGRGFTDVAFDEEGNLWAVESPTVAAYSTNLWKFAAGTYESHLWPVDTASFYGTIVHAGAGYVALGGVSKFGTSSRADARLLNVAGGTPELLNTGGYFANYYAAAPAGYAEPAGYTTLRPRPFVTEHAGRTYLVYAAYGLGDVYELEPAVTTTLAAPAGVTATGTGLTSVSVAWSAVDGAARYEVFRRTGATTLSLGTTTGTSLVDAGCARDSAYAYYVRALSESGKPSADSANDVATTVVFTDAAVTPGMGIKAVHVTDLRRAAAALGVAAGLPPRPWTESVLIRASQVFELRTAVNEGREALGLPALSFTDATLTGQLVKAVHMQQLRNGVQ
jgi:hypothetical protein